MVNIWQNSTKSLPKNDSRVVRVNMETSDMGARKSHLPTKTAGKNSNDIKHVKG